mmetsp:Transcript_89166/g.147623  ORF Transcript_89166/g.147623 Transcript_89166/m.147623 type:complete len:446 (-) Transcript_89166:138-1475(-)
MSAALSHTCPNGPVLCIFFDLEATGLYLPFAEVIELSAVARVLSPSGEWHNAGSCNDAEFHVLVRCLRRLPKKIARLTGLSEARLQSHGVPFRAALGGWFAWLRRISAVVANSGGVSATWLIAHNGLGYDLPLLAAQERRVRQHEQRSFGGLLNNIGLVEGLSIFSGIVDTLRLSRQLSRHGQFKPSSHKLSVLHQFLVGRPLAQAHTARGDAIGLADLCKQPPFHNVLVAAINGRASAALSLSCAIAQVYRLADQQSSKTYVRAKGTSKVRKQQRRQVQVRSSTKLPRSKRRFSLSLIRSVKRTGFSKPPMKSPTAAASTTAEALRAARLAYFTASSGASAAASAPVRSTERTSEVPRKADIRDFLQLRRKEIACCSPCPAAETASTAAAQSKQPRQDPHSCLESATSQSSHPGGESRRRRWARTALQSAGTCSAQGTAWLAGG